jgi:hypothetical protein
LLTLVDERFYWWFKSAEIEVTGGTTTWAELYAAIGTALGITITADEVPAAYLKPPTALTSRHDALPVLLDAVASSVGQRVVRRLDGSVLALNSTSSRQVVNANLIACTPKASGGTYALP